MEEQYKYRLEYSEAQGGFHYDNGTHEKNSFGWIAICDTISERQANEFTSAMWKKYPATDFFNDDREKYERPTIEQMKQEFKIFLLSEPK